MSSYKRNTIGLLVRLLIGSVCIYTPALAQKGKKKESLPVSVGDNGKLAYEADKNGDRIPDFSYCGYMASNQPIPTVPVKVIVPLKKGDATLRIQSALDYVASLPVNADGFRGTVLLEKGTYEVDGTLKINASGVVLRGSGMEANGTVLLGTGKSRATLIQIVGKKDLKKSKEIKITDDYVSVNAFTFHVANAGDLKAGDMIMVHRPSTQAWISKLGTDHFGGDLTALAWKPGERDINWDRTITAVNGNEITIDAPITTALDSTYGGGLIAKYEWPGRIDHDGIENLSLQSTYDVTNPKDEAHRWMAITVEDVSDAWVRQVIFEHFAGSAVFVEETANKVTVEDCKSLSPISEIGGQRRNTFWTTGGQTLFQRLYSVNGIHDFATGYCTPGPTAFVQCSAWQSLGYSGGIDSWSSGVLFDIANIDGEPLSYMNKGQDEQGAGWNIANSVLWNCSAAHVDCYQPPTAQNWAFGTWAQFGGDGYWQASNEILSPRSLYYAQLADRLNNDVSRQAAILRIETEPSSSPTVAEAAALMAAARKPATTIGDWVDQAPKRNPIATVASGAKTIDEIGYKQPIAPTMAPKMSIANGWIVRGNTILEGKHFEAPWWNGNVKPDYLKTLAKRILPAGFPAEPEQV